MAGGDSVQAHHQLKKEEQKKPWRECDNHWLVGWKLANAE
jgi:hypothetical protein